MFEKLYNVCRTPGRATVIGSKLHSTLPFLSPPALADLVSTALLYLFRTPLHQDPLPTRFCNADRPKTFLVSSISRHCTSPQYHSFRRFTLTAFKRGSFSTIFNPLRQTPTLSRPFFSFLPVAPFSASFLSSVPRNSRARHCPPTGDRETARESLVIGGNKISRSQQLLEGVSVVIYASDGRRSSTKLRNFNKTRTRRGGGVSPRIWKIITKGTKAVHRRDGKSSMESREERAELFGI